MVISPIHSTYQQGRKGNPEQLWGQRQGQADLWSLDVALESARPGRASRGKGTHTWFYGAGGSPEEMGHDNGHTPSKPETRLEACCLSTFRFCPGWTHRGGGKGLLTPHI